MKKQDLEMRKSGLQTALNLLENRDLTNPDKRGKAIKELENKEEELDRGC